MKMPMSDEFICASETRGQGFATDVVLVQQIGEIVDGADAHKAANLIGAYKASADYYNRTGDIDLLKAACESESELRALLTRSRLKKAQDMLRVRLT